MEKSGIKKRWGAAARFIDDKLATGRVAFALAELVKETGLSVTAARNQLLRLGDRVVRPAQKHQFFLIVAPEHRAIGAPPVTWWLDDYFKWLSHPYYLALQSAAAAHGAAPQALQVTQVMTDTPRREIIVGRLRIRFFVKRAIERTTLQSLDNTYAPFQVSTPEATAFDLVRYASRIGGIGNVVETLVQLLPHLRASELKRVLAAENEISTVQRLGYIIATQGQPKLAEIVHAWLPARIPLIPFVPSKANLANAPVIARWHLRKNSFEPGL
jgi:hypothetical protein